MRTISVLTLVLIFASFVAFAKDAAKKAKKKSATVEATTPLEAKKDGAPCETKEDILKKLEEEKKVKEASRPKAFSLQGSNTGCSVK